MTRLMVPSWYSGRTYAIIVSATPRIFPLSCLNQPGEKVFNHVQFMDMLSLECMSVDCISSHTVTRRELTVVVILFRTFICYNMIEKVTG
jgi:hypothetical protein